MNNELNQINGSIEQSISIVRKLPIDKKLKNQLLTELYLSFVNVEEMEELI